MFVDYDGVVKTYAEGFPTYHNREQAPFSHSMIRVLSYIAWEAALPAYFIPISSSPGKYSREELEQMFRKVYQVDNLFLHPEIEITPVRTDRQLYVRDILQKYQVQHHLVLDDEPFWYENQGLNYFQTDTFDGISPHHCRKRQLHPGRNPRSIRDRRHPAACEMRERPGYTLAVPRNTRHLLGHIPGKGHKALAPHKPYADPPLRMCRKRLPGGFCRKTLCRISQKPHRHVFLPRRPRRALLCSGKEAAVGIPVALRLYPLLLSARCKNDPRRRAACTASGNAGERNCLLPRLFRRILFHKGLSQPLRHLTERIQKESEALSITKANPLFRSGKEGWLYSINAYHIED